MEHVLRHDGIALPPCPRCGCRPEIVEGELGYFIRCPKEGCEISTGEHVSLAGAILEWDGIERLWNPLLSPDPEEGIEPHVNSEEESR